MLTSSRSPARKLAVRNLGSRSTTSWTGLMSDAHRRPGARTTHWSGRPLVHGPELVDQVGKPVGVFDDRQGPVLKPGVSPIGIQALIIGCALPAKNG
ncbi:MAG: hypothetical protein Ct9H300mP1_14440 [Planctomycetaceae bacterium]|nr:MAG: hypothetical protein Ct9H300mP1_14440 [Planctomycetaceae bacterium]